MRPRHAFWQGFAAAGLLGCAILVANAFWWPDRPGVALTGVFALGVVGWLGTGRRR